MDFFESMTQYLLQNRELQKAVGDRIYPFLLPQQPKLPAIVYTPITTTYGDGLQRQTGFVRQIVQFTVHNTTFGKARHTGRVLKGVLQDLSGDMCGVNIQATHTLSDLSSSGDTMTNYKTEEYSRILEFEFDYMEE
jgi:hypothetical protein